MNTEELRSRIKNYIDHADERILRIFNAIMEVEAAHKPQKHYTEDEISREEGIGSVKDDHRLK